MRRAIRTIAVVFLSSVAVSSSGSFSFVDTGVRLTAGSLRVMGIAVADLNADGLDDIVTSTYDSPGAVVYLNQAPGGIFTPHQFLGGWGWHRSVAAADVDADGDIDLAVSDVYSVQIYLNTGTGTFQNGQGFSTPGTTRLEFVDLNGDGVPDLVSGGFTMSIWLNNRTGVFTSTGQTLAGSHSQATGDFDGNGTTDLITSLGQIYLNNGAGHFVLSPTTLAAGDPYNGYIMADDLNGDGCTDVMGADSSVHINNGDGTFRSSGLAVPGTWYIRGDLRDMDGDSDLDLVARVFTHENHDAFEVQVHINDGHGGYSPLETLVYEPAGWIIYDVQTGDLDALPGADIAVLWWGAPSLVYANRLDRTPPIIAVPSLVLVEADGPGGTVVTYAVSAQDGNDGAVPVWCTPPSGSVFALDDTEVHCHAVDRAGNEAQASFYVFVKDTTPPVITSALPSPSQLWPPDHRLVPVSVAVTARDAVTTAPACQISRATSSEPENGTGDGDTGPDWVLGSGDLGVQLRAERTGGGPGRVYSLTISCVDEAGNFATKTATVTVPRSQGKK